MPSILITGGAGFIGSHTAHRYLGKGWKVHVYDNMSRVGAPAALEWLSRHPQSAHLSVTQADVRDYDTLAPLVAQADVVLHAAGQTAVTKSVANPRDDFLSNALGTLNVLEAARASQTATHNPVILYTSTNKLYGGMEEVGITLRDDHYAYTHFPGGMSEAQPLDFHSPYGCSKGTGDQYMRDYARIYGLRTVVLRQSCIYGVWQFGTEDQGWLAHFTISALLDKPLNIYGDGKQVRDVLYIDDLVNAYDLLIEHADIAAGQIFNIGGGPQNAVSLLDLIHILEELRGKPIPLVYDDWRPGDQRVYVSDTTKLRQTVGWEPAVGVADGVGRLYHWARENRDLLLAVRGQAFA